MVIVSAFFHSKVPLHVVVSVVRGNSLISHLLLLVASRQWHALWHSETRPTKSTLDCEDCQLIQSHFEAIKVIREVRHKVAQI